MLTLGRGAAHLSRRALSGILLAAMRCRTLALIGFSVAAWLGCSSDHAVQSGPPGAGRGEQAPAGSGGSGAAGSGGRTPGSGGVPAGVAGGASAGRASGGGAPAVAGHGGTGGAAGLAAAGRNTGGAGTSAAGGAGTTAPPGWTCEPATYGDGACNCGCGVVDSDCPDEKATSCEVCDETSCWPLHCDKVEADDNAHCSAPPPAWNCSPRLYRDGARCDCGCGALDPDCASADAAACDKCDAPGSCSAQPCPGTVSAETNGRCDQPPAPPGWTCPPNAYADGLECDCGCGVADLDCRTSDFDSCVRCLTCGGHGTCVGTVAPEDPTQCAPPPSGWLCSDEAWRDAICDCGCGIPDVYCQDIELSYVCGNFPVEGCSAGDKSHIDPNHNELCLIEVPSAWTCARSFYYDGFCDCGCGALDLDCAEDDVSACEQCDDEGSCSSSACPGTIAPGDSAHCTN